MFDTTRLTLFTLIEPIPHADSTPWDAGGLAYSDDWIDHGGQQTTVTVTDNRKKRCRPLRGGCILLPVGRYHGH